MNGISKLLTCSAIVLGMAIVPASANPSKDDIAGALVLLGIAALAHNQHHYRDGQAPSGAQDTADFERGYRDGLHNYEFDARGSDGAYGHGYDAGIQERSSRNTHQGRAAAQRTSDGPNVPPIVMQGCAAVVATNFGVGAHDVHITRTVQRGDNDFMVEAAVGHKYMNCVMDGAGQVVDVVAGRMQ